MHCIDFSSFMQNLFEKSIYGQPHKCCITLFRGLVWLTLNKMSTMNFCREWYILILSLFYLFLLCFWRIPLFFINFSILLLLFFFIYSNNLMIFKVDPQTKTLLLFCKKCEHTVIITPTFFFMYRIPINSSYIILSNRYLYFIIN